MGRGLALAAVLLCALLLGCGGETRVTLLTPVVTDAGRGSTADASPDADSGTDAAIRPPLHAAHLIHRYGFEGEGTRVVDSIGSADGIAEGGAVLDGAGHLTLDGKDDYVNLPNGLVSGLKDATLIAWLAWSGGPCWQRVFDFGSTNAGEDTVGKATSSLFLTPLRCPGSGPATSFQTLGNEFGSVDSDTPFPQLELSVIAVAVDMTKNKLRLYAAGESLGSGMPQSLAELSDENDWLGRSQWVQDTHFMQGTYDEFRIYDVALSDAELAALEAAGPDALGP